MFENNIRFQIAAVIIFACIVVDYYKNPHLKVLTTKYFKIFLGVIGVNLFFDLATVYTITHIDDVSTLINRIAHQVFIATVIMIMFVFYIYTKSLANDQKRFTKKRICIIMLPLFVSLIFILFGELKYYVGADGVYSYGMMVQTVYACGIIYFVLSLITTVDKKNKLTASQRSSLAVGLTIWVIVLFIQLNFPTILLSGLGFVILALFIYFSSENQKENYDIETNSYNRAAFHKMMSEYYEKGGELFLINVVCNNYDKINSLFGHDSGIGALKYLSDVIYKYVPENVYHSRTNTFSIFINEDINYHIDKLDKIDKQLKKNEYEIAQLKCHITVFELRKYTHTKDEAYELINFLNEREKYSEEGVHFITDGMVDAKLRRDKIAQLLTDALANDEFEMFYQPIFWAKDKKYKSAEALIRLTSSTDLGYISPEEFIPIAEEKGMMLDIGDRVIEMIARFIYENKLQETDIEYIEMNLSGIQAGSPGIHKRLEKILNKYEIEPSFINLEITETVIVNSGMIFAENLKALKKMGFSFSMDDFGTGYSNLSQMCQNNYELIKIDKSIIWPVFYEKSEKAGLLLDSVINMLERIGESMVAEGVETKEMADYLVEKGVEHLQGYLYSKPVNEEAFLKFIEEKNK